MLCPYGNEAGEPARRSQCALKAGGDRVEPCLCDMEMIQLTGQDLRQQVVISPTSAPLSGEPVIDPQTVFVCEFWIAREAEDVEALGDAFRATRPVVTF